MWDLYLEYAKIMKLNEPLNPLGMLKSKNYENVTHLAPAGGASAMGQGLMLRLGYGRRGPASMSGVKSLSEMTTITHFHWPMSVTRRTKAWTLRRRCLGPDAPAAGKPLRQVKLTPSWMIAAVERGDNVRVPRADDVLSVGDTVLVIGMSGMEEKLRTMLGCD